MIEAPQSTVSIRPSALFAVVSLAITALPVFGQSVVATVPIPANPTAIAVNTVTNKVYISGFGNITVIDGAKARASGFGPSPIGNEVQFLIRKFRAL